MHVVAGTFFAGEQSFDYPAQLPIAFTGLIQQAGALFWIAVGGAMEQLLNLRPAFGCQEAPTQSAFPGAARLPPISNRGAPYLTRHPGPEQFPPWRARQNSGVRPFCTFVDRFFRAR